MILTNLRALTANIENSWDSGFSNLGSPYQAFVSGDRNVLRISLISILATRSLVYETFYKIRNPMNIEEKNLQRQKLNKKLIENDDFFGQFGKLDDDVYSDGAIPKKYKELTGLSISILTRCEECILYHLQGCLNAGANKKEIIESIKMGVIGGGSITYPSARYAMELIEELKLV